MAFKRHPGRRHDIGQLFLIWLFSTAAEGNPVAQRMDEQARRAAASVSASSASATSACAEAQSSAQVTKQARICATASINSSLQKDWPAQAQTQPSPRL
jgi:hypothetical protein